MAWHMRLERPMFANSVIRAAKLTQKQATQHRNCLGNGNIFLRNFFFARQLLLHIESFSNNKSQLNMGTLGTGTIFKFSWTCSTGRQTLWTKPPEK